MNNFLRKFKPLCFYTGLLLILISFSYILYINIINAPFVFDDLQNIAENPYIQLSEISWEKVENIVTHSHFRPVAHLSFAVNYYFDNYNVTGYHLINIIIHIINGLLLFIFTKKTILLKKKRSNEFNYINTQFLIPFFAALLWFVHPLDTQSVTYIVQRMNSMATMFYILSALMYIKAREAQKNNKINLITKFIWKSYIYFSGCLLFGLLAIGSKQNAITLPIFILSYELFFIQRSINFRTNKIIPWLICFIIILIGILFVVFETNQMGKIFTLYKSQDFNMAQRLLTEPRVIIYYISLFIYPSPSRLMLEYNFPISQSLFCPPTTILSILTIVIMIYFSFRIIQKERLIAFSLLWYFGALSVESSIIGLAIIFEHRTYLPFMFLSIISVKILFGYFKNKVIPIGILCAIIFLFSFWTYQRNAAWQSPYSLYSDNLTKAETYRIHLNIGVAMSSMGNINGALSHYRKALILYPYYTEALLNIGNFFRMIPNYSKALYYYQKALSSIPFNHKLQDKTIEAKIYNNIGSIMLSKNDTNSAITYYKKALKIQPYKAETLLNLGLTYSYLNRTALAINALKACIKNSQNSQLNVDAHYYIGLIFYKQGRYQEALEQFKINPNYNDTSYYINRLSKN